MWSRSGAPSPSGCAVRSPSCRRGVAWPSCCSTWKATPTPRSPGSSGSPRGRSDRRCSTRDAACAYCWGIGRRTDDAGTAAVRSPARSGAGRRLATGARRGGRGRVPRAPAGAGRRRARRRHLGCGAGPVGPVGSGRCGRRCCGGGVFRGTRHGGIDATDGRGGAARPAQPGARGGGRPGLRAGQLERTRRHAEPFEGVGPAPARGDVCRRNSRGRRRPGPVGPLRLRRRARPQPGCRPPDGRVERRAGVDAAAARLRPRHPAAPLDPDECGVGHDPAALRLDAGGAGCRGRDAALARPAGEVPRPYGPASASKREGRFGWKEAMRDVRQHLVAVVASLALGAPVALAAQQQEVTLAEAVRRALQVQPAMVQARGDARNAGASGRSALGAFLPTVSTSASAARSNQDRFDPNSTARLPPIYSYTGGLSASLELFDGFRRLANLRASGAAEDAAGAGLVNQRYQTTLATQQLFYGALAAEELVRVAEAQVKRAAQQLRISVDKLRAGSATRSDTLRTTVDFGNARLQLLQAQANLATAQANLGRQIGVDQPVRAVPDTAFPGVPDTAALRPAALATAPQVEQADAQARAARAQVWSARAQYWPSLTVSYSNSRTGTDSPGLPLVTGYPETFTWRLDRKSTRLNSSH